MAPSVVKKDGAAHASYTYDANGNRESVTEGASTTYATFDAQGRLILQGSSTYQYSADGQLSSKTVSSVTTTYDYDELGSLMEVASPSKTVTYKVDGLGRRVVKKVDGVVTNRFLYGQGLQPIAELDATGSGIKSQFVYASEGHSPDFLVKGGVTYRFIKDQVGSVRLVVDTATGTVAQRIDYDAWGKILNDTSPGFQPFGFAGGLYDADTGLTRFGARDYDAEVGRWTAKDPILFDGGDTNLYAYVASDPINLVDPSGEIAFLAVVAIAWGVVEVGSAIIDSVSTARTLSDPCASGADKLLSGGLWIFGALAPGAATRQQPDMETKSSMAPECMRMTLLMPRRTSLVRIQRGRSGQVRFRGRIKTSKVGPDDLSGTHGGGPHINFDTRVPDPSRPGRFSHETDHIYFWE